MTKITNTYVLDKAKMSVLLLITGVFGLSFGLSILATFFPATLRKPS